MENAKKMARHQASFGKTVNKDDWKREAEIINRIDDIITDNGQKPDPSLERKKMMMLAFSPCPQLLVKMLAEKEKGK